MTKISYKAMTSSQSLTDLTETLKDMGDFYRAMDEEKEEEAKIK